MQVAQLGARLDGQVGGQEVAHLAVGAQRIGLAAGAVQRQHPLQPEPLAERMGSGERLQLGDEIAVPAAGQQRLGPRLQHG